MKWSETTASRCRYGSIAERIWGDWNIIWEDSEEDYQGHASFIANKGRRYCFYEWWYGSCSVCDGWESDDKSDNEIETEMRNTSLWLTSKKQLINWMTMLEGVGPVSNYNIRGGGLTAEIDILRGGLLDRINAIRKHLGIPPLNIKTGNDG